MRSANNNRKTGFLSFLLSILMFLLTCIFVVLLMIRAGNAAVVIRHTDISGIIEDTDVAYYIVNTINNLPFNDNEIDLADVEEFIRSEAVSDQIGVVARDYARALTRGDLDYYLSSDDLIGIVQNLEPELFELLDHRMTEEDNERMARIIDDIVGFNGLSVGDILEDAGIGTTIPFLFVSPYLLLLTGVLCFAVLFVLYWLNKDKGSDVFLYAGVPVLLLGLVFLSGWMILDVYPHLLGETFYRYSAVTGGIAYLIMWHGIITGIVGVLFVLLYFAFRPKVVKGGRGRR